MRGDDCLASPAAANRREGTLEENLFIGGLSMTALLHARQPLAGMQNGRRIMLPIIGNFTSVSMGVIGDNFLVEDSCRPQENEAG